MDLITWNFKLPPISPTNLNRPIFNSNKEKLFFGFCNYPLQFNYVRNKPFSILVTHAKKKKNSQLESPILQPNVNREVTQVDDEQLEELEEEDLLITDGFDQGIPTFSIVATLFFHNFDH